MDKSCSRCYTRPAVDNPEGFCDFCADEVARLVRIQKQQEEIYDLSIQAQKDALDYNKKFDSQPKADTVKEFADVQAHRKWYQEVYAKQSLVASVVSGLLAGDKSYGTDDMVVARAKRIVDLILKGE